MSVTESWQNIQQTEVFRSEVRDGMRIDWDVPIRMDDGVVLRADIFRPVKEGQYPAILSYGPYGKGLAFQEGYKTAWDIMVRDYPDTAANSSNKYQSWEVVDPEKWVPDGYVCVRVDSRGAGRSPGVMDHHSPRETKDLYLCIEWTGGQGWSNGKAGLNGISYYASNQWRVAGLKPPHLAAMCVWEGYSDRYREGTRHGGILSTFTRNWAEMQVRGVQHGLGERGPRSVVTGDLVCGPETLSEEELAKNHPNFWAEIEKRPIDDPYYRERSADFDKIETPFLSSANWGGQGLHLRGDVEGFVRSQSKEKWLEVHGGSHWALFYTDYGVSLQKRFFDYFLKGEANGWDKQPRVQLNVRHLDRFELRRLQNPDCSWRRSKLRSSNQATTAGAGYRTLPISQTSFLDPIFRSYASSAPSQKKKPCFAISLAPTRQCRNGAFASGRSGLCRRSEAVIVTGIRTLLSYSCRVGYRRGTIP